MVCGVLGCALQPCLTACHGVTTTVCAHAGCLLLCCPPRRAAANDKDSGKRLTAATCSSVKVMGFLTQLLMTPYGQPGKARWRGARAAGQGRAKSAALGVERRRQGLWTWRRCAPASAMQEGSTQVRAALLQL